MSRILLLTVATCAALLLSAAAALAYRKGGPRRLWVTLGVGTALLEAVLLWSVTHGESEGPAWLTALAVIPPILLLGGAVQILAKRRSPFALQVAAGAATGMVGYVGAAFVAYFLFTAL